jgi:hypothetical protein
MNKIKTTMFYVIPTILFLFTFALFFMPTSSAARDNPSLRFEITFPEDAHPEPITGRIYVILSRQDDEEPRLKVGWTEGIPLWGKSINALKPGDSGIIDGETFGFPLKSISDIPPGEYYVQGFINIYTEFQRADGHTLWLHNDQWEGQQWNRSPGNLYSDVEKVTIDSAGSQTIQLECKNVIPPIEIPPDTKWVKRIKFQSRILTEFWGQPMFLGATVLLPRGYDEHPDVSYPVNYIQGHFSIRAPHGFRTDEPEEENRWARRGYEFYEYWNSDDCPRMIAVTFQHPCPYYDDSYGVNSPNTGPYGDAIMLELIPKIEETFRIIRKPYARVLSGGSTGGWISLALQVYYPDFFGGTWSFCPDPVDFRYYQIVNIYEDKNAYYFQNEWMTVERPNLRSTDGNIRFMMKDENHYEYVVGDKSRGGGQWDIWEAVFSPIGEDGYPRPIWDKLTGEIDHEAAEQCKKYDLRLYLEENWDSLGHKLAGKLHIYTGSMDSFYLNNAVVLLEEFLECTTNPYYEGVVKYGDRKPHCWGPRGKELYDLFKEYISRNADEGDDRSLWNY